MASASAAGSLARAATENLDVFGRGKRVASSVRADIRNSGLRMSSGRLPSPWKRTGGFEGAKLIQGSE